MWYQVLESFVSLQVAEGDDVDLGGSSDDDGMADYIREEQEQIDDEFEREYKTLMQVITESCLHIP